MTRRGLRRHAAPPSHASHDRRSTDEVLAITSPRTSPAEHKAVAELRAAGLVEEVFLKADATGPVLLTDTTAAEAHERLKAPPFGQEDLVAFDYIELSELARDDHR
jgi:hypothetical protein